MNKIGPTLLYKINAGTSSHMRQRLMQNGATEIKGFFGEISGAHVSEAVAVWLQTMAPLSVGDTVDLQGYFHGADHTSVWGVKIG